MRRVRLLWLLLGLALLVPATAPARQTTAPAQPSAAEAHLANGYDALRQDRYTVAADEFRAALAIDGSLVLRARFPLAIALFEMHKFEEARQELQGVRQAVGDHPNVMYYMGRVDVEKHKFAEAVADLTKAAAKPPFPDTAYYLGYAHFRKGDLSAAEEWLKKAELAIPHDARVPYQLGFVYREEGKKEDSAKAFARAAQLRQRDADEARIQSECVQKLDEGLGQQAEAVCNQLYDDNDAGRLTELGTLYGQHGDYQAALKPLRRAAELAPQSPQMQFNLALVYFQLKRFADARAPLRAALQRWPDLFQLNALYGAVLWKLGEQLPAYQALHHAHELNPADSETSNLLYAAADALGQKEQAGRRYSDALHYYAEAASVKPAEAAPHRAMARIYTLMGKKPEARLEQERAERLAKNLPGRP